MSTGQSSIARSDQNAVQELFGRTRVAIGVVHCPPLPGSPRHDGEPMAHIVEQALEDALAYVEGGMDGLIIENHGDVPFLRPGDIGPETAAAMAVITARVRERCPVPIGINVLANAPIQALAVAKAADAAFVRVNQLVNAYVANEGLIEGEAGRVMRYRRQIDAGAVRLFADTHVKHGAHAIVADRPLEELTRDLAFFDADAVIATGHRTGDAADIEEVRRIKEATPLAVLIGSGVRNDNVQALFEHADGVIVGSALKENGHWWNKVVRSRVERFARIVRACRGEA